MEKSAHIKDKYILLSNEDKISYTDEMIILQHLVNKFNLINQSEYAGSSPRVESNQYFPPFVM
jgi:hypothetical protein